MEKEKEGPSKKVLVVIDESECSYYALMWVLNNLKESLKNLSLVIFAAQPPPSCNYTAALPLGFARMYLPLSATPDLINSAQEQNKKVSLGLLEKANSICTSQGVNAETIMIAGDPKEAICHAVQKYKISFLVIGDHANGTLKRAFLGSVSNYCLHNAKCPVLVVRKPV